MIAYKRVSKCLDRHDLDLTYVSLINIPDRNRQTDVDGKGGASKTHGTCLKYEIGVPTTSGRPGIYLWRLLPKQQHWETYLKVRIPAGTWIRVGHRTINAQRVIPLEELPNAAISQVAVTMCIESIRRLIDAEKPLASKDGGRRKAMTPLTLAELRRQFEV
jgi:hypothetical protein